MSTGDGDFVGMDAALAAIIRDSAKGLVRSGVMGDAQAINALSMEEPAALAFTYDMPMADRITPSSKNAALQLVATTTSQSQDIEAQRAAAIQKLQGALSKVPHDQRADLQARIDAVAGATNPAQIDALTTEALRDIEAAAQFAATGTNIQDLQSREDELKQRIQQLQLHIHEADKKISGLLGEMEDGGVVFEARDKKRMAELQAWVEAHPDDKRSAQYEEYVALQRKMAIEAEHQADDPHSHVTDRPAVKRKCAQVKLTDEERKELQKEYEESLKENSGKEAGKTATASRSKRFNDPAEMSGATYQDTSTAIVHSSTQQECEIGNLEAPQTPSKPIQNNAGRSI